MSMNEIDIARYQAEIDLIPVLRNDGVYCFYDRVSETYLENLGTGTLTGA